MLSRYTDLNQSLATVMLVRRVHPGIVIHTLIKLLKQKVMET